MKNEIRKLKQLDEYAKLIKASQDQPVKLADIQMEIASDLAYYRALWIPLKVKKPDIWISLKYDGMKDKTKPLSDKLTEMKWRTTTDGAFEYALKLKIEALKEMSDSIGNVLFAHSNAAKGLW